MLQTVFVCVFRHSVNLGTACVLSSSVSDSALPLSSESGPPILGVSVSASSVSSQGRSTSVPLERMSLGNPTMISCDDGLAGVPLDVPLQQPPVLAPCVVTSSDVAAHTLLQSLDEKVRSLHQQLSDQEDHGSKGFVCVLYCGQVDRLLAAVQGSSLFSLDQNKSEVATGSKVLVTTIPVRGGYITISLVR